MPIAKYLRPDRKRVGEIRVKVVTGGEKKEECHLSNVELSVGEASKWRGV